ncbi:MAG: hypothetical protein L6262_12005 [Weeksellaceae bacterium]|nr:hypothetical protein [Weeksellaceae bacterium]
MKSIFTCFIIFTIALRPLMPFVDYAVNYHYISQKLCENRSRPQLLCKGTCYLKKEIAKTTENQAKNASQSTILGFSDPFIIQETFLFDSLNKDDYRSSKVVSEQPFIDTNSFYAKIFHPPLI